MDKVVGYLRVSTVGQRASGLGLESQMSIIEDFCRRGGFTLDKVFTEVESGRRDERPILESALTYARRANATLLVARLDRLSRSVKFVAAVLEAGVPFRAADVPDASRLLLHILAAVAESEARAISERTSAALKAAKARGTLLGAANPRSRNLSRESTARGQKAGASANREKALNEYSDLLPLMQQLRERGESLRRIAENLNARGDATRTGCRWSGATVKRVIDRASKLLENSDRT